MFANVFFFSEFEFLTREIYMLLILPVYCFIALPPKLFIQLDYFWNLSQAQT